MHTRIHRHANPSPLKCPSQGFLNSVSNQELQIRMPLGIRWVPCWEYATVKTTVKLRVRGLSKNIQIYFFINTYFANQSYCQPNSTMGPQSVISTTNLCQDSIRSTLYFSTISVALNEPRKHLTLGSYLQQNFIGDTSQPEF